MKFVHNGQQYIIASRALGKTGNSSRGKTSRYLLKVDSLGERQYISSLYETGQPGQYFFDYAGRQYVLKFDTGGSVTISGESAPV